MTSRKYAGRSAEARARERSGRLLDAALELWGELGWAGVTMRGVCAQAGLNDRYFYESFEDVEALLLTVYDRALERLVSRMVAETQAAARDPETQMRAATRAFVNALTEDPRSARIGLTEPAGSPALERRRRNTYGLFANLICESARAYVSGDVDETALTSDVLFVLGGIGEIVTSWIGGSFDATNDELIELIVEKVLRVASPWLR